MTAPAGRARSRRTAGRTAPSGRRIGHDRRREAPYAVDPLAVDADGGDSPAWSRKRQPYQAPPLIHRESRPSRTPSCTATPTSASSTAPATRRSWPRRRPGSGLTGLAVTDHDGFYGVVRFSEAARELELPTIFGAELSLGLTKPQNGEPDPRGPASAGPGARTRGLRRAGAAPSREGQLAGGEKGKPDYGGAGGDRRARCATTCMVLTGCRKGPGPARAGHRRRRGGRPASWTGWSRCSAGPTSWSS